MAYAIYQIDETNYGTQAIEFKVLDYKDQAVKCLNDMINYSASKENANETQPTKNHYDMWHLYLNGSQKRTFVMVRKTKNCDGKAEAIMKSKGEWID